MASTLKLAATVAIVLFAVLALGMAQPPEDTSCSEDCQRKVDQCVGGAECIQFAFHCAARCQLIVCQNLCSLAAAICGCAGNTACEASCSKQRDDCQAACRA